MATAEVIKTLSSRATAAEQMIKLLRKQVEEIRQSGVSTAGKFSNLEFPAKIDKKMAPVFNIL